jgi:polyhydroxyalkanoate synthase
VRNCYLENKLRIPGETQVCGEALDLTLIDVPAFVYASREDHIVPWQSAYASHELLAGETTFVLGASGHIAGVINPPAKNKRNHWVGGTEGPDAGRWLETARNVPGSWWPEWGRWLARQAGERVPARTTVGNRKYRPIEAAPGRYVKEPA